MTSYISRAPRLPGRNKPRSSSSSCSTSSSHYADPVATLAAQRVNDSIDEEIRKEAAIRQGDRPRQVKIIILGQAEAGKSSLLKQFQLYHASETLNAERPSWRIVVYANLIKAVRTILEEFEYELGPGPIDVGAENEILALRRGLLPLISLEGSLTSELSDGVSFVGKRSGSLFPPRQGLFAGTRLMGTRPLGALREAPGAVVATNRAAQVLGMCVRMVEALWRHRAVQNLLRTRKLRLEESGSFFLGEVHRIAQPDYVPSIDDVLHVRLQTVGVIEHSMHVRTVSGTYLWKIYDVGGVRSQRPAWASYFDDVNALIFLAPIAAFDQYLDEDPLTNRISDSLQLLTSICANVLLKNAQLVLLLNKTDLLRRKLEAGIQIRDYITSYGNRPNNFASAAEYFRTHFLSAHKKKEAFRRTLFIHFTSMLDVQATQVIIASGVYS
ncbi:guanine nucleotide binding protein, alpha subunit [Mycena amicta]|nr:guanine nucleotide binding protein, alpha subunit [Mycena amicta]